MGLLAGGWSPLCCWPCPPLSARAAHPDGCGIFGTVAGMRPSAPGSLPGGEGEDGSVSPRPGSDGRCGAVPVWGLLPGLTAIPGSACTRVVSAPSGMAGRTGPGSAAGPRHWG